MADTGTLNPDTWYTVCKGSVPGINRVTSHNNQQAATEYAKTIYDRYKQPATGYRVKSLTGRIAIGKGLYRTSPNRQWEILKEYDSVDANTFYSQGLTNDELADTLPNADKSVQGRLYGVFPEDLGYEFRISLDFLGSNLSPVFTVAAYIEGLQVDFPEGFTVGWYMDLPNTRIPHYGYFFNPETPLYFPLSNVDIFNGCTVYCDVLGVDRIDNDYFSIDSLYSEYIRGKYQEVDTREIFTTAEFTVPSLDVAMGWGYWKKVAYLGGSRTPAYAPASIVVNPKGRYTWEQADKLDGKYARISRVRAETWIYSQGVTFPSSIEHEYSWLAVVTDTNKDFWETYDTGGFQTAPFPSNWTRVETKIYTLYSLGTAYLEEGEYVYPATVELERTVYTSSRSPEAMAIDNDNLTKRSRVKQRRGIRIPGLPQSRLVFEYGATSVRVFIETEGVAGNPFGGEDSTQFGVSFGINFSTSTPSLGFSPIASIWGVSPYSITKGLIGGVSGLTKAITNGDYQKALDAGAKINKAVDTAIQGMANATGSRSTTVGRYDK